MQKNDIVCDLKGEMNEFLRVARGQLHGQPPGQATAGAFGTHQETRSRVACLTKMSGTPPGTTKNFEDEPCSAAGEADTQRVLTDG